MLKMYQSIITAVFIYVCFLIYFEVTELPLIDLFPMEPKKSPKRYFLLSLFVQDELFMQTSYYLDK